MFRRLAASIFCLAVLAPVAAARDFASPPPAAGDRAAPRPAPPADAPAPPDRIQPTDPIGTVPDRPAPVKAPTRAQVWRALATRRDHNVADFRRYRKRGVYPHNNRRTGPLNVWRDRDGHLCAAATMIDMDGQHAMVAQVAKTENNVRLLDVTEGPLLDWMLTSGLTLEEIDMIQAPMVRPSERDRTRDPAWRIAEDARLRRLYVGIDAYLVTHRTAGLAQAVDRLMENPALARRLVDGKA